MTPPSNITVRIIIAKDPRMVRIPNVYYRDAASDDARRPPAGMPGSPDDFGLAPAAWTPPGN
jgi:hypothetical protein